MRGRILVIDHKTPTPDQDSGSASTFSYLQILSRAGYDVTFAPFNLEWAWRYTNMLKDMGIATLSALEWTSISDVIEAFAPSCDILLLYRAAVAVQLFDCARRVAPAPKILFHPVDLHFSRLEREAALTGNEARAKAAKEMRAIELNLIARADATIVVSQYEYRMLRQLLPQAVLHEIPIMREPPLPHVPGRFGRWLGRLRTGADIRRDILFIGGYEHTPNIDAVLWFVREVWPRLQARGFSGRFIIAGSKMPREIAALASDKIDVRGYVKDLAPLFAACQMSVAPIRYGGGIKGKIVTSLSYGVPVVATSVGVEGMNLQHDANALIADTPDAMADQIVRLQNDAELWCRLSANGYRAFQEKFSIEAGTGRLLSVMDSLIASRQM